MDRQYWTLVAADVPGKSADECYEKVRRSAVLDGVAISPMSAAAGRCCRLLVATWMQFYEQQPSGKSEAARPRKYITTAQGPPPSGLTNGGRKAGPAKARQWARQVRFEQRHGGGGGSDDDEEAAQALQEQVDEVSILQQGTCADMLRRQHDGKHKAPAPSVGLNRGCHGQVEV